MEKTTVEGIKSFVRPRIILTFIIIELIGIFLCIYPKLNVLDIIKVSIVNLLTSFLFYISLFNYLLSSTSNVKQSYSSPKKSFVIMLIISGIMLLLSIFTSIKLYAMSISFIIFPLAFTMLESNIETKKTKLNMNLFYQKTYFVRFWLTIYPMLLDFYYLSLNNFRDVYFYTIGIYIILMLITIFLKRDYYFFHPKSKLYIE